MTDDYYLIRAGSGATFTFLTAAGGTGTAAGAGLGAGIDRTDGAAGIVTAAGGVGGIGAITARPRMDLVARGVR